MTDKMKATDRDSSDAGHDEHLGSKLFVSDPVGYREAMAQFTLDASQMISSLLSEIDFKNDIPHVFRHPVDISNEVAAQNQCGWLLKKALIHTKAVLAANHQNNLHSMAVQSRVVLECAAQLLSTASAAEKGTSRELKRIVNTTEYEVISTLRLLYKDTIELDSLHEAIVRGRQEIGVQRKGRPRRVTIGDKLKHLKGGPEWYAFLSENFCKNNPRILAKTALLGGVIQPPKDLESFAFGYFLDFHAGVLLKMLIGYGFLLIPENGDSQTFDDAIALKAEKRKAAQSFQHDVPPNQMMLDNGNEVL